MKFYNIQRSNVGNLGDIIKHAALVYLAKSYFRQSFTYVDTHSFLLETSVANIHWQQQTKQMAMQHSAYKDYYNSELSFVRKGRYLCSAGLMLQQSACDEVYLAENNPGTHKILQRQIDDDPRIQLFRHYRDIKLSPTSSRPVLLLFDPFAMDQGLWQDFSTIIQRLSNSRLAAIAFHYDKQDYTWPGLDGWQQSHYSLSPFHLTLMANFPVSLQDLGWKTHSLYA